MPPEVGVVIPEQCSGSEMTACAASIEAAGLDSAWFTDIARESLIRAAFVASVTSRINIGTAVALWTRTPIPSAGATAELHELSGSRFIYGWGPVA